MSSSPPITDLTKYRTLANADLVMKGGITSGVVYPKAVVRVARDYRIHNIGGTSVGAIAAALTASAEYWRRTQPDNVSSRQQDQIDAIVTALDTGDADGKSGWDNPGRDDVVQAEAALTTGELRNQGYAGLYGIPQEIGSDLLGKFRPTARTRGAFQFLVAWLEATTPATRAIAALTRQFYLVRTVSAVLVALLALAVVREPVLGLVPLGVLAAAGAGSLLRDRLATALTGRADDDEHAPADGWRAWLKRWQWPLVGALSLVAWALVVQIGVGWPGILRWIGNHWLPLLAILAFIGAVAVSDEVKRWLAHWLAGDDATRKVSTLNRLLLATAALGIIVLLLMLWWQWDTISADWDTTGPVAVGAALGWVFGGVVGLLLNLLIFIPANDNGICTGLEPVDRGLLARFPWLRTLFARLPGRQARPVALTDWLTTRIDTVAGTTPGHHLTFDDLDKAIHTHPDGSETGITFEAIASELHRGVPLNIPRALDHYGFKPKEFLRFFPQTVVESILASSIIDYDAVYRAQHPGEPEVSPDASREEIVRFPRDGRGIPVVVGARMSMSFPVLFSTVPIYHLGDPDRDGRPDDPLRVPLSDGGIVSNFPIHKFDRALSPWPTFAIDLIPGDGPPPTTPSDDEFEINAIETTREAGTTRQASVRMMRATSGTVTVAGLVALASQILNTARGWIDNSQKTLPGYAERIVGIRQYEGEGGLNLTMSHTTIEALANRGMRGIDRLVKTWNPALGTESQWHQHRWLRYRILMRSVENLGQEWTSTYTERGAASTPSIADLVAEAAPGTAADRPAAYAYRWQDSAFGKEAARLTALFDAFASATPVPAAGAGTGPSGRTAGVFDQAIEPVPEPTLLMIPPFE